MSGRFFRSTFPFYKNSNANLSIWKRLIRISHLKESWFRENAKLRQRKRSSWNARNVLREWKERRSITVWCILLMQHRRNKTSSLGHEHQFLSRCEVEKKGERIATDERSTELMCTLYNCAMGWSVVSSRTFNSKNNWWPLKTIKSKSWLRFNPWCVCEWIGHVAQNPAPQRNLNGWFGLKCTKMLVFLS